MSVMEIIHQMNARVSFTRPYSMTDGSSQKRAEAITITVARGFRFLLLVATACVFSNAQQPVVGHSPPIISIDRFQLVAVGRRFFLQPLPAVTTPGIPIPRTWLISPQEERDEEEETVSSIRFDRQVASFPIGNGEIAVVLSSYDMMREGSMQAASGRDVFLIYDPTSKRLLPGRLNLGVTKGRSFGEGCWYAQMVHFYCF